MTNAGPLRILAIVGYGRSGSTLLDMALGQHPEIEGAGELTALSRHVWPNDEYCACGRTVRDCEIWGAIGRRWTNEFTPTLPLERYVAWQEGLEAIVSPVRILARSLTKRRFAPYAERTASLFEAIRSHVGKDVIVDSSKLPGRALALAKIEGIELYAVHLVRDGRGVAWSMSKGFAVDASAGLQKRIVPKPELRTAIRWILVNLAAESLRWRLGPERYVRVRYEDFVSDPSAVLSRIGHMVGLDMSGVAAALEKQLPVRAGHQMAGSRLRMGGPVRLSHDEAWRMQMPAGKRARLDRFAGWLLRRYGYGEEAPSVRTRTLP